MKMLGLDLIQPTDSDKVNHLRAAAALWIFVFHYYHFIAHSFFEPLQSQNPFLLLVYHGYFFVYLFFILSGYLLAKAYPHKLDLKSFFTKRIGRIFPAYYLCIFVYSLLFATGMLELKLFLIIFSFDLGAYPRLLGYLWFINRLLECYLSFPLLWWIAQKTGQTGLATSYLLCLLVGAVWVIHFQVTLPDYYFSFVLCLSHFILGMLAAKFTATSKHALSLVVSIVIFMSLLECLHQSIWQTPLAYTWISLLWLNFIAVLFVVIIRAYLLTVIYLPQLISVLMQKMGHISYSFYLYHFLVLHFFIIHREDLSTDNSLNFMGLFMISTITAVFFQWLLSMMTHAALVVRQGIRGRLD